MKIRITYEQVEEQEVQQLVKKLEELFNIEIYRVVAAKARNTSTAKAMFVNVKKK